MDSIEYKIKANRRTKSIHITLLVNGYVVDAAFLNGDYYRINRYMPEKEKGAESEPICGLSVGNHPTYYFKSGVMINGKVVSDVIDIINIINKLLWKK